MTRSWRTTALGILAAVVALGGAALAQFDSDPATVANWSEAFGVAAAALGLGFARDNVVTSEQAKGE